MVGHSTETRRIALRRLFVRFRRLLRQTQINGYGGMMKMWSLRVQKPFDVRSIVRRGSMALVALATLGWAAGSASAAVLNVGTCVTPNYSTIGAAVSAAKANDTVSVCPGTYREIVTINKNITLIGKTPSSGGYAELKYPYYGQCAGLPYSHDCPQIIVENATANVEHLHISGYDFNYNCYYTPVGILFLNASGSAQYNNITDEDSTCELIQNTPSGSSSSGIGVWSDEAILAQIQQFPPASLFNVLVQGNYIDNFGETGVYADGVRNNVTNNSIGDDNKGNTAIEIDSATLSSALNNTIWGSGDYYYQTGIELEDSPNATLTRNSITDVHVAIDMEGGGTSSLTTNTMTDVTGGVKLVCSSNNKLISNSVSDQTSADGEYGANLFDCETDPGSDNNLFNGNKFNGLCAGVLTGDSDNTGNTFISNVFTNIGPGMNIMPGNSCPAM